MAEDSWLDRLDRQDRMGARVGERRRAEQSSQRRASGVMMLMLMLLLLSPIFLNLRQQTGNAGRGKADRSRGRGRLAMSRGGMDAPSALVRASEAPHSLQTRRGQSAPCGLAVSCACGALLSIPRFVTVLYRARPRSPASGLCPPIDDFLLSSVILCRLPWLSRRSQVRTFARPVCCTEGECEREREREDEKSNCWVSPLAAPAHVLQAPLVHSHVGSGLVEKEKKNAFAAGEWQISGRSCRVRSRMLPFRSEGLFCVCVCLCGSESHGVVGRAQVCGLQAPFCREDGQSSSAVAAVAAAAHKTDDKTQMRRDEDEDEDEDKQPPFSPPLSRLPSRYVTRV